MKREDRAIELGHAHLKVRTLDRSVAFYTETFGLGETERIGNGIAFLSSSNKHHALALQALGDTAGPPAPGRVGLYHVAFEVPDAAALEAALARLDRAGVSWQAVDHGISWAAYFSDPDGNGLELYLDRRRHPAGRKRWGGITEPLTRTAIRSAARQEVTSESSEDDRYQPAGPTEPAQEGERS